MSKEKSAHSKSTIAPKGYAAWVISLKKRIAGARQKALLSANAEQIKLHHEIGREILNRQNRQGWGAKVIDRLSADLREAFPDMKGLSASNLKYMRFFAQECPDRTIGQQPADQLPWFHIVFLITKLPILPSVNFTLEKQFINPGRAKHLNSISSINSTCVRVRQLQISKDALNLLMLIVSSPCLRILTALIFLD